MTLFEDSGNSIKLQTFLEKLWKVSKVQSSLEAMKLHCYELQKKVLTKFQFVDNFELEKFI